MFFCPFCGTLLFVERRYGSNVLGCSTCPYSVPVGAGASTVWSESDVPALTVTHSFRHENRPFFVEDATASAGAGSSSGVSANGPGASSADGAADSKVPGGMDGADALTAEGGQVITVPCENEEAHCDSTKAYYIQIQMRSADEPPSTFFKCVKCGHQWRQD